jgi:SAM-dependent methyltransferase
VILEGALGPRPQQWLLWRSGPVHDRDRIVKRLYTRLRALIGQPAARRERRIVRRARRLGSPFLSALCLAWAHRSNVPGLAIRRRAMLLALRLWLHPSAGVSRKDLGLSALAFAPMDSVRYFEFDFAWRVLADHGLGRRFLDIASPRLLPVLLLKAHRDTEADWVNPDGKDLAVTERLAAACGLAGRCRLHGCRIEDTPFAPASFDAVTSISVVEHIPDDTRALARIWNLLRPGGRLVLSVPCAAEAFEEYVDLDEYGLQEPTADGFYFGQRFYDTQLLADHIFRITGSPRRYEVFGEKIPGSFIANREAKLSAGPRYPFWEEPCLMAREWASFPSVAELPGWGVIAMEFVR